MISCRRVLPLLPLAALAGCYPSGSPEPAVIAHVAPLSGPGKAAGEHARQAIDLAVEEANKEDRRTARPVLVYHGDSRGEAERAENEVVRLLTVRKALALLDGPDAALAGEVARAAQPYAVPVLTPAPLAGPALNDFVYSTTAAPAYQGQVLAQFAAEELKADAAVVLADARRPACGALAAAFVKEFTKEGRGRAEELSWKTEADFADLAARVKKAAPTAVLVAGGPADLAKLRGPLHDAAPEAALLLGGDEGLAAALAADPGAGKAYLATAFAAEGLTPAGQEFAKRYRDRFGHDLDAAAALAYDGVRLLIQVLRRARPLNGTQAQRELSLADEFDSLTGPLAIKGHSARRPVFVVVVEEGRPTLAKRYDAEPK